MSASFFVSHHFDHHVHLHVGRHVTTLCTTASPMAQQHAYYIVANMIRSHTYLHQLQHSMRLLQHLTDPLGDLRVLIGHLHVNLLLLHHLNDNHHLQITLLASAQRSSSARVTSVKFQLKDSDLVSDLERPGPKDRTPGTPESGKKLTCNLS